MIGFIILFLVGIILFVLLNRIYLYFRDNTSINPNLFIILFAIIFFGGFVISILSFFVNSIDICRILSKISYYWLGLMLYMAIGLLISLITRLVFKKILKEKYKLNKAQRYTSIFVIIFTLLMNTYGIYNGHNIHITKYQLITDKSVDNLHIAFISDLHLGYNVGLSEVDDMVNKLNELNPDIVLIGGDIFDNEYLAIEKPEEMIKLFNNIHSKYGVYTCLGNHDVEENIFLGFTFHGKNSIISDEMLNFLNKCNIKLLYEDYVCLDNYIIYGRPDYERVNLQNNSIKSIDDTLEDIDNTKYLIVLDHEPRFMDEYANNGVDLLLNGHTHNGQIWPGTLTIKLFWDNSYGYKKYNQMDNIVSSGIGLYGVNMRIGSFAEICDIYVNGN